VSVLLGVCLLLLLLQDLNGNYTQSVELVEDPSAGVADNNPAAGKWDQVALWLGYAVGDVQLSLVHPLPERQIFAVGDLVRHRDVTLAARYTLLAFQGRVGGGHSCCGLPLPVWLQAQL
jgi:hypothetical protein